MKLLEKLRKVFGYTVNRPLETDERESHLPQGKPAPIPVAWPQWSVIRMNSIFLECVDLRFQRKGFVTTTCFAILPAGLGVPFVCVLHIIEKWSVLTGSKFIEMLLATGLGVLLFSPLVLILILVLLLESFDYTHYPIRFNRKTRRVHVMMDWKKGKVLSIPWEDVYFTCSSKRSADFIIFGHQLAEDGETVLQTFELPHRDAKDSAYRFMQWEFVRQYMEGDEKNLSELAGMVTEVMDVAERRETPWESFRRMWVAFSGRYVRLMILFLPLALIFFTGRVFAMWTSKIPRWPEEIEAECRFEPNDPNIRDGQHLVCRDSVVLPDVTPYVGR